MAYQLFGISKNIIDARTIASSLGGVSIASLLIATTFSKRALSFRTVSETAFGNMVTAARQAEITF